MKAKALAVNLALNVYNPLAGVMEAAGRHHATTKAAFGKPMTKDLGLAFDQTRWKNEGVDSHWAHWLVTCSCFTRGQEMSGSGFFAVFRRLYSPNSAAEFNGVTVMPIESDRQEITRADRYGQPLVGYQRQMM